MSDNQTADRAGIDLKSWLAIGFFLAVLAAGLWYWLPRAEHSVRTASQQVRPTPGVSIEEGLRQELAARSSAQAHAQAYIRGHWIFGGQPDFPREQQQVEALGDGIYLASGEAVYDAAGRQRTVPYSCYIDAKEASAARILSLRLAGRDLPVDGPPAGNG
jgi:hypothetical protein